MEEKKKKENERKDLEKILKSEEIKNNNEMESHNKEKEKDREYIISYIKTLDKKKKEEFTPIIYRHPEKIYLKAIDEYEKNKESQKKINNQKNSNFDLILNRAKINKYCINAEKREEYTNINNNYTNDFNIHNNKLKTSNSNNKSKENKESKSNFHKKKLLIKLARGNSTANEHKPTLYKSPIRTNNNIINYINSNSNRKLIPKRIEKRSITKKTNSEEKREITLTEMMQFLLENENEVNSIKKPLSNPINYKKATKQKNKILNSLNDPFNPYSVLFYNNMLYNNYNVGIHFRNIKQGVPNLRIKKMKGNNLPPLYCGNNLDEKILSNTYSTNFNSSNKKKNIILPITLNNFNLNSARKKLYSEKENDNNNSKIKTDENEENKSKKIEKEE